MDRQQDLFTDLPRGEQLAALRKLKLQTHACKSGKVSGAVQKSVLKCIDDHQGDRACFASQDTIAEETGYGVSTVRRAVAALIDQDLITKERPNHWSPNHHRINWTELTRVASGSCERSTALHEPSTAHTSTSDRSQEQVRAFTEAPPSVHHERRNAPLNANTTDHLTAPWMAVVGTMKSWGLVSAQPACQAAKARGLSIEFVAELFREAGGDREPQRWEPGLLANWLTGKASPPIDEAEAIRRREAREQAKADEAERIRESVRADGERRGAADWVIEQVTARKLEAAGLGRFAASPENAVGTSWGLKR